MWQDAGPLTHLPFTSLHHVLLSWVVVVTKKGQTSLTSPTTNTNTSAPCASVLVGGSGEGAVRGGTAALAAMQPERCLVIIMELCDQGVSSY